ncbi:hypothetical protein [Microbacterium gorillae]|uniref:hypothetical protein n=1 Tax=Microbacterium gorillae TaxID=1231063 RepID=UPI003D9606C8
MDVTSGYTFACTPGTIYVEPEGNAPVEVATEDLPSGMQESPALTGTEASATSRAAAAITCPAAPIRTIISGLQVNMNWCLTYGQRNHAQNGSWTHRVGVEWKLFTGWPKNENYIRTTSGDIGVGQAQVWGRLTLQRQQGIIPPLDLISSEWQSSVGVTGYPLWIGGTTYIQQGTYAERVDKVNVTDFTKNVSIEIQDPAIFSPRYYCNGKTKRCSYPNGQEAPVL